MRFVDETSRAQASTKDGPRQAALMLHSMPVGDRDWLLAQLNDSQRESMQTLLKDLSGLGIPPGRRFAATSVIDTEGVNTPAGQVEQPTVQDLAVPEAAVPIEYAGLFNADPGKLVRLAAVEPARLTALLLRAYDWPWRDALLAQVGAIKRRQIEVVLAELDRDCFSGVPTKLAAALIADVAAQITAAERTTASATAQPVSLGGRIRQALHNKKTAFLPS